MKRLGFEFHETMTGTYTRSGHPDEQGHLQFRARAAAKDALRHLRDGKAELAGTLDMENFADDVPFSGTIEIAPILKRIIRYEFSFVGNDGHPYRFAGQKDIRFSALKASMTTLLGAITDGKGEEIARATLHFDVAADLLPFLVSFKPALI